MILDLAEVEKLHLALMKLNGLKLNELEFVVTTPHGAKKLKFNNSEIQAAHRLTTNNFDYLKFLFNFYRAFPEEHTVND